MKIFLQVFSTMFLTVLSTIAIAILFNVKKSNDFCLFVIACLSLCFWWILILRLTGLDLKDARTWLAEHKTEIQRKERFINIVWILGVLIVFLLLLFLTQ